MTSRIAGILAHQTEKTAVRLFETSPMRGGLSDASKKKAISLLAFSGITDIETAYCFKRSTVNYDYRIKDIIAEFPHTRYWISASDECIEPVISFGAKNVRLNVNVNDSMKRRERHSFIPMAIAAKIAMRVSVNGAFEGNASERLVSLCRFYQNMGAKVVLCDNGRATPLKVLMLFKELFNEGILKDQIAVSFAGPREKVIRNISAAFALGVRDIETSVLSSVTTDEMAGYFDRIGFTTGINLERLKSARIIFEENAKRDLL